MAVSAGTFMQRKAARSGNKKTGRLMAPGLSEIASVIP
jgi:hypothetical protein